VNSNKSHPQYPSFGPHERASGVYKITNTANGRIYIGMAFPFRTRWLAHKSQLRRGVHHNTGLQHDWNSYGSDVFRFEVVELAPMGMPPKIGWQCEAYWINKYRQDGIDLYNLDASKLAEEARKRNRARRRRRPP
jgi:group I intron endonuclease